MCWHPGQPADQATRLRVSFTRVTGGTEVRVVHGGWEARGEHAQRMRDQYDEGWPQVLKALLVAATRP